MKTINSDMGHVIMDEFDIHDMLARRSFITDELENLHQVTIVPTEKNFPAAEWQKKINDLLNLIDDLDCDIHDVAEYTCHGTDIAHHSA